VWLTAAKLAFICGCLYLYRVARRPGPDAPDPARRRERTLCGLVGLLTLGGFLLAHVGMNDSWTGHAVVTNVHWLLFALLLVAGLALAHLLLCLMRSCADETLLPVAALLVALGLVNIYVWETRDADAYISTVALPKVTAYAQAVEADRSIPGGRRAAILDALGPVPNALVYERERRNRFATVLNSGWLDAYNESARRFERARALDESLSGDVSVHEVRPYRALRKQVLVAALSLLLVPAVLLVATRSRAPPWLDRRRVIGGLGLLLLATSGSALLTANDGRLPAMLEVGGHRVIVYEFFKVGFVAILALALSRLDTLGWVALVVGAVSLAALLYRDHGSSLTLVAIAVLMVSLVVSRRWRFGMIVAGIVVALAAPIAVASLGSAVPETVRVRLAMWADPWGSYERAQLDNQVAQSFERLVGFRTEARPRERVTSSLRGSARAASPVQRDVRHIEEELRWRLAGLAGDGRSLARPFVPGSDPVDERVLLEAESLWAAVGGYSWDKGSGAGMRSFRTIVGEALAQLRQHADRHGATVPRRTLSEAGAVAAIPFEASALQPDDFQLQRGLFALRAGGLLGLGLGLGRPEAVPGLTEDVPLTSLGEALGFAGVALVVLLLLLIVGKAVDWGRREERPARGLLLVGGASLFGLQGLISVGGTVGILPFTGLTFPFISRSGTALVADFLALGALLALAPAAPPVPARRDWRTVALHGAGFSAAFAVVLASVGVLQLTGRTLTPGSVWVELPRTDTPMLHAANQWSLPSYRMVPGPIVDRNGRVLAETTAPGALRVHPHTEVATSLGHTLLQLELAFRSRLVGGSGRKAASPPIGPTLVTTIDAGVQRAVHRAFDEGATKAGLADLRRLRGAVVVLDVRTGEILALESRPSFALDELGNSAAWARAEARDRREGFPYRYLNRPILGYYPPGSIFKTVTATGALDTGLHTLRSRDFDYRSGPLGPRAPDGLLQLGPWQQLALPDGPPITDGNHPYLPLPQWNFSVETAYAWSSNIAFAQMGLQLGAEELVDYARRFGFERTLSVPGLGSTESTMDNGAHEPISSRSVAGTASALARSAFGQGQVQATPLQMALVPAGIANRGKIMQPHVVAGWKDPSGRWIERTRPRVFADLHLKPRTVRDLQQMMRYSATYGWARHARLNARNAHPGVAGKTGSSEWSSSRDLTHAWFIGYLPTESPRIAVALIVERAGPGPRVTVPIAREIFASTAVRRYLREAARR